MKKVCMLLKRNKSMLEKDSRVLRESQALVDAGFKVVILIYDNQKKEDFSINGAIVKTVTVEGLKILHQYNAYSDNKRNASAMSFMNKVLRKTYSFLLNKTYLKNTFKSALDLKSDIYHCHDFETL